MIEHNQAYQDAGIVPSDVDVIELRDYFTCNGILTYSALGLVKDAQFASLLLTL